MPQVWNIHSLLPSWCPAPPVQDLSDWLCLAQHELGRLPGTTRLWWHHFSIRERVELASLDNLQSLLTKSSRLKWTYCAGISVCSKQQSKSLKAGRHFKLHFLNYCTLPLPSASTPKNDSTFSDFVHLHSFNQKAAVLHTWKEWLARIPPVSPRIIHCALNMFCFILFFSILNFEGCFAYIWLFNTICNFFPLPSGCNCPLHILPPIP